MRWLYTNPKEKRNERYSSLFATLFSKFAIPLAVYFKNEKIVFEKLDGAALFTGACCGMVACDDDDNETPPPTGPDATVIVGSYSGTMQIVEA